AAASCRTSSFARLTAPLGRPAPGRFPPCPFIVPSRGCSKIAGHDVRYPDHLVPQYGTAHDVPVRPGTDVVEGVAPLLGPRRSNSGHLGSQSPAAEQSVITKTKALFFFLPPAPDSDSNIHANLNI